MRRTTTDPTSSIMSSDNSAARNEAVEEGLHSTMETTNDDAPPSTTSWWNQKRNKIFVSVTVMTVSIALSVGVFVSSRGNKTAKQANPSKASGGHETATIAELSSTSTPRGKPTASSEDRVCKIMATKVAGMNGLDEHNLWPPNLMHPLQRLQLMVKISLLSQGVQLSTASLNTTIHSAITKMPPPSSILGRFSNRKRQNPSKQEDEGARRQF
jgi:hypothetical protein